LAGLTAVVLVSLSAPMAIGLSLMGPLDIRMRRVVAIKEQPGLDHPALAAECLKLMQQGVHGDVPTSAWPPSMLRLRPTHFYVEDEGAWIELCGGFDHFGYTLQKTGDGKAWTWHWYTEEEEQELLKLPVDATPQIAVAVAPLLRIDCDLKIERKKAEV